MTTKSLVDQWAILVEKIKGQDSLSLSVVDETDGHTMLTRLASEAAATMVTSRSMPSSPSKIAPASSPQSSFTEDNEITICHIAETLLRLGANVRIANRSGWSATHIAAYSGQFDLLNSLLVNAD